MDTDDVRNPDEDMDERWAAFWAIANTLLISRDLECLSKSLFVNAFRQLRTLATAAPLDRAEVDREWEANPELPRIEDASP